MEKSTKRGYAVSALMLLVLFVISVPLDESARALYLKEGGLIETVSAASYLVCAAYMLTWPGRARAWPYIALMVLFAMRESDFDKRFTEVGVLKSKFFFTPLVPMHQKLVGAVVLAFALFVLYTIVRRDGLAFVRSLQARSVEAWGWAIAMGLIVVSKGLDGLDRKLAGFGIQIDPLLDVHTGAAEEILELGIGLYIFLACRLFFARSRLGSNPLARD